MNRYKDLTRKDINESLYKLRDAFLAAKKGEDVDEIINFLLTPEEKIMIGRRVLVAEAVSQDMPFLEICNLYHVGKGTVVSITRQLEHYLKGYRLIIQRGVTAEKKFQSKKYRKTGGSNLVYKKKEYTGVKRKDIER